MGAPRSENSSSSSDDSCSKVRKDRQTDRYKSLKTQASRQMALRDKDRDKDRPVGGAVVYTQLYTYIYIYTNIYTRIQIYTNQINI